MHVNTVSPTHASEIARGVYAENLRTVLQERRVPMVGILNGIDYELYNPAFDEHLASRYDLNNFVGRRSRNKKVLQQECGFKEDADTLLVGMVSRLMTDKGLGLLEKALPELLGRNDVQLVIMGSVGDYRYRESLSQAQEDYPTNCAVYFAYDEPRARHIYGGADVLLIPSLVEPCGLQQMIAMRYGAIPLVHRTGGLADTVAPWDSAPQAPTPQTLSRPGSVFRRVGGSSSTILIHLLCCRRSQMLQHCTGQTAEDGKGSSEPIWRWISPGKDRRRSMRSSTGTPCKPVAPGHSCLRANQTSRI